MRLEEGLGGREAEEFAARAGQHPQKDNRQGGQEPPQQVLRPGHTPGEAFVSNALVFGRYVLRACIVNFHTARADVEALPKTVARIGRTVDAELRPTVP